MNQIIPIGIGSKERRELTNEVMEVTMAISDDTFEDESGLSGTEAGWFEEASDQNCEIYRPCDLVALEEREGECQEIMFAQAFSGETGWVETCATC
jgi:hypothetical protein